jgi:hypothetical protein
MMWNYVCFAGCQQEICTGQILKNQLQTGASVCRLQEIGSFLKLVHAARYSPLAMGSIVFSEPNLQLISSAS